MNASSLKLFLRISLLVMLAVTLSACGGGQSDLDAYVAQVKSRSGGPIDPLPEVIKPKKFEYEAEDMRDPFSGGPQEQAEQIEDVDTSVGGLRPDPTRRKEVLEGFELDSLKMVGTFFIEEVLYALISDPDGLIHRVRPENYLGRNHGRILNVYDDRIELQELVRNGADGWMPRDAKVALDES